MSAGVSRQGKQKAWVQALGLVFCALHLGARAESLHFERDIRPLLKARCFQCHGEGEKPKGGVDLRLRRLMLGKSESGTVLVPGKPEASTLIQMIRSGEMPKGEKKLSPAEIERLTHWVEQGAPTLRAEPAEVPGFWITEEERAFWSFQPVKRPVIPVVQDRSRVRTPVDAFLLQRLEERGLGFAPEADRRSLIRRVTYDLTGLPPTPAEVRAFVSDPRVDAYERVVDRLLGSERHGERWARYWLDVAGYADSNGASEADSERPWVWRYRDYVIRSFNAGKPLDQFIQEQLAGDEMVAPPYDALSEPDLDRLVATGFLRLAPDPTGDGPADAELARNQVIADTLHIVSSSLLGLTVQCAQCHDHRYDPIPQSDYYRLRAVFEPAFNWKEWRNPGDRLVSIMSAEDRSAAACVEMAAQRIDAQANALHNEFIEKFVQKQLLLVPEDMRDKVMGARRTPADKRTEAHKQLLREFPTFQDHILLGEVDTEGAKKVDAVRQSATELRTLKPPDPLLHVLVEAPGKNIETVLFHRGDHQQPRGKVNPGGLSVLPPEVSADLSPTNGVMRTTGRRLAFARTLTNPSNPLTPRVLANRFFFHVFGQGLVGSLGDFGALGERPSHPELLDWLAMDLMESGWKHKAFLKRLVLSSAYRQATVNADAQAADPDNRLFGRARLKRLDAESLRDSLLAVSGRLNETPYGPSVPVALNPQGQFVVGTQRRDVNGNPSGVGDLGGQECRRSIYVQVRRSMPVGVMEVFDAPTLTPNCEARAVSTVPPQALMLLNDHFVLTTSFQLAALLQRDEPHDPPAQVRRLWELVYAREASPPEVDRALLYLSRQSDTLETATPATDAKPDPARLAVPPNPETQALASLCQVLLGSNRFLYLD